MSIFHSIWTFFCDSKNCAAVKAITEAGGIMAAIVLFMRKDLRERRQLSDINYLSKEQRNLAALQALVPTNLVRAGGADIISKGYDDLARAMEKIDFRSPGLKEGLKQLIVSAKELRDQIPVLKGKKERAILEYHSSGDVEPERTDRLWEVVKGIHTNNPLSITLAGDQLMAQLDGVYKARLAEDFSGWNADFEDYCRECAAQIDLSKAIIEARKNSR